MVGLTRYTSSYRSNLIYEVYKDWLFPNMKVLDVGCGTGVVTKCLEDKLKVKMTGCDIINYLQRDLPFLKMKKINNLPVKDSSFDAVMFNDVLHHTEYENQIILLKESLRVSKKILIFELKPTLKARFFDYILNKAYEKEMNIPFAYRSRQEWLELFKSLKVKIQIKEARQPWFYPFNHIAFCLNK